MTPIRIAAVLALGLATPVMVHADTIALRDGSVIHGEFLGATARSMQVRTRDGIRRLPITDVARIDLDPRPEAEPDSPPPDTGQRVLIVGTGPEQTIERDPLAR